MIYLIRHGLDDENYIGGWSDVDLTSEGVKQVSEAGEFIKDNLNITKIISSDIKRAKTSAKILSEILRLDVCYTKDLRELDKGDFAGKHINIEKEYPDFFDNIDIYTKYPNGESMIEFYNRICLYFDKLIQQDNSLIVTHRGVINMIYFLLNNKCVDMNKKQFGANHGSIHELDPLNKKIRKIK